MGSVSGDGIEKLMSARKSLRASLEKSKSLGLALEKTGPRLDELKKRLPSLESAVRPILANKDALESVGDHINRAVTPAASVLKVFDAVHGLEKSLLSDPRDNLSGYLSVVKRLEEALKFLGENCGFAIKWLEDMVDYLEENTVADHVYLSNMKRSLKGLLEFQKEGEQGRLDDGLLEVAFSKLEGEFRRLLTEHSVPLSMSSPSSLGDQACIAPSPLPVTAIPKLQAIIGRLHANGRLERCISVYIEVRGENVKSSLGNLDLGYLKMSVSEFNNVQSFDPIISWGKHLEFAVKHLFEAEYKLCNDVFERFGSDVWMECFSGIAAQAGMLAFLQFGRTVTESKSDPIKLLKLLDIFASLNKLRLDFNRLFGGKACTNIQSTTRDLIKRIIDGASEIFWEILTQVERQRQAPPPPDGSVPRLVSLMTTYCNKLLGDDYKPILIQVLFIHRSWRKETFQERLLLHEVVSIFKAIELNLETWSKAYENSILSYFFLMNTHWHLYKHLKGTTAGDLMGDIWLREHEQYKDYYATIFLRESWGKLPALLSREGLLLFSGGRATARDLVKKRLKAFNETFDDMYKKQSEWVLSDKDLRDKTGQLIVQTILPVYRSYMQNYGPLVEQEGVSNKYAKYTVQALETMFTSLFQPKPGRYGSFKSRQYSGNYENRAADQNGSSPSAA